MLQRCVSTPNPRNHQKGENPNRILSFLVARLRRAMIRFAQILGREYPIPSQARPMRDEAWPVSDCPGAPRQKNSAPFRFRGLRKSRENCTSAESFFLSETGASRGAPVSVLEGRRLPSPWSAKKDRVRKDALFLVPRLRRGFIRFAQIGRRGSPSPPALPH